MALIDRRIETLHALDTRIKTASTFGAWLGLLNEQDALRKNLHAEHSEVNRLARGWTYIPPPRSGKP